MDRLQKRCFIGSAIGHAVLLLVFLTSSAFVSAPNKTPPPMPDLQIINFIPLKTVDENVAPGGGNPNAAPPPEVMPAPPAVVTAPAPQPEPPAPPPPAKEADPEPPAPKPQPPAPKPAIREPAPKPAPKPPPDESSLVPGAKKRTFELKKVVRNLDSKADSKKRADERARAREAAAADEKAARDAHNRLVREFASSANSLGKLSSGGIKIELLGPGGGGLPYANFWDAVMSAYNRAWHLPEGITDNDATAVATIKIARDGTVISARISQASGNSGVDASVRRALDRVKWVAPLPDSAKEDQRTISIKFNVGAKRGLG